MGEVMGFQKFGTGDDQRVVPEPGQAPDDEGLHVTAARVWSEQDEVSLREENESADGPPASPGQ
jgi:hypothetical protein